MSSKDNRHDDGDNAPSDHRNNTANHNDDGTEGSGKVAQAHNSTGDKAATQLNQGRRSPESRHDRDAHIGSGNQVQSRQGGGGSTGGGGNRGAG